MDADQRSSEILEDLKAQPNLGKYVDPDLPISKVFRGSGEIRLVFLGQDPTVANPKTRAKIKTALDLSRNGQLRHYLEEICSGLGLPLDGNVYATNYLKNFFRERPTQI